MSKAKDYLDKTRSKYDVPLPSGAIFKIRKPNQFWFTTNVNTLTAGIPSSEKMESLSQVDALAVEANAKWTMKLVEDNVLEPKIRLNPNYDADEIGFGDIEPEDATFIVKYLLGLVDAAGSSTTTFSGQQLDTATSTGS